MLRANCVLSNVRLAVSRCLIVLLVFVVAPVADAQTLGKIAAGTSRTDRSGSLVMTVSDGPIARALARESARLGKVEAPRVQQPPQTGSERSWPARHPVMTGFLIGAAVGSVLPLLDEDVRDGDTPPGVYMATSAALFGGIGALTGWLVF